MYTLDFSISFGIFPIFPTFAAYRNQPADNVPCYQQKLVDFRLSYCRYFVDKTSQMETNFIIETENGPVQGTQKMSALGRDFLNYQGIPYMKASTEPAPLKGTLSRS